MRRVPRAACINDISGFGRCSLTTALPVLSVMGVQACPAPTAVLSKHTGFSEFSFTDLTDALPHYFETWRDLDFDWIYSGFLGAVGQIETVRAFFKAQKEKHPGVRILLDPAMGDGGRRYSTYTQEMCDAMRGLVAEADVITPNLTEVSLLTGLPYCGEAVTLSEAETMAERLMALGCGAVVITGIVREDAIGNLTYDGRDAHFLSVHRTESLFSGTGDLFASVLCGALAHGLSLNAAAKIAGDFISEVTQYTLKQGTPVEEGVLFEPLLTVLEGYLHGKTGK